MKLQNRTANEFISPAANVKSSFVIVLSILINAIFSRTWHTKKCSYAKISNSIDACLLLRACFHSRWRMTLLNQNCVDEIRTEISYRSLFSKTNTTFFVRATKVSSFFSVSVNTTSVQPWTWNIVKTTHIVEQSHIIKWLLSNFCWFCESDRTNEKIISEYELDAVAFVYTTLNYLHETDNRSLTQTQIRSLHIHDDYWFGGVINRQIVCK